MSSSDSPSANSAKTVLITGASKGIGHAVALSLLQQQHNVILVARTEAPLLELKQRFPGRTEYIVADLADLSTGPKIVSHALRSFPKIDALVINHGIIQPIARLENIQIEDWVSTYNINFFSAISLISPLLPHLRSQHSSIVFLSSGASISPYSAWGPYGSTKAALNHLALQLAAEEKSITAIALRPGSVETSMQQEVRDSLEVMDEKDQTKFRQGWQEGKNQDCGMIGGLIGRIVVGLAGEGNGRGLSGRYLSWDDHILKEFREA